MVVLRTAVDLRGALATAASAIEIFLPPASHLDLNGSAIVVPAGVNVSLSSIDGGATLDGAWRSRIFEVHGTLTLSQLHLTRGLAPNSLSVGALSGGGAIAVGPGGSLLLLDSAVSSSATAATVVPTLPLPILGATYFAQLVSILATAQATGEHGGGIAVAATVSAVIIRSTLTNLSAPVGGAVSNAGRLHVQQGAVAVVRSVFGAGIAVTSAGELVLLEASISYAHATADGGAVYVLEATGTAAIDSCSITNCSAVRVRATPVAQDSTPLLFQI